MEFICNWRKKPECPEDWKSLDTRVANLLNNIQQRDGLDLTTRKKVSEAMYSRKLSRSTRGVGTSTWRLLCLWLAGKSPAPEFKDKTPEWVVAWGEWQFSEEGLRAVECFPGPAWIGILQSAFHAGFEKGQGQKL